MMKVLVTGGAGFIGSNLVDRLIDEDFETIIIDNLSSGNENNINPEAKFYKLDIQDPHIESVFQNEKPDLICHLAAQKDVRISVTDPIFDAEINIIGALNIFQNCIKYNAKKVIFSSTGGAIYGEQDIFPAPETHPARPISPYGITKLAVEKYLFYYKAVYGLDYVSLRYANVYGPRQDPYGEAGVVAIFIQQMLKDKQPVINGDGKQTRDFVYVSDVVNANILAIRNSSIANILNIGTGVETSIKDIFNSLKKIINSEIVEKYVPAKQGEQRRSVIDNTKAEENLLWKPKVSLEDGLKKTCAYFLRLVCK